VKTIAEARNVPLLEPAGIVMEAGTVRAVELELRATVPPPVPLRITVQVLEAPGAKIPGLHTIELIELIAGAATLTVPPVPVTAIASPIGEAPKTLPIVMGRLPVPDGVTDRVATTPSEIALEFNPQATHV
jgi:hypothetical protein